MLENISKINLKAILNNKQYYIYYFIYNYMIIIYITDPQQQIAKYIYVKS